MEVGLARHGYLIGPYRARPWAVPTAQAWPYKAWAMPCWPVGTPSPSCPRQPKSVRHPGAAPMPPVLVERSASAGRASVATARVCGMEKRRRWSPRSPPITLVDGMGAMGTCRWDRRHRGRIKVVEWKRERWESEQHPRHDACVRRRERACGCGN